MNNIYLNKEHSDVFIASLHLKEAALLLTDIDKKLSDTLLQITQVLLEKTLITDDNLNEITSIEQNIKNTSQNEH